MAKRKKAISVTLNPVQRRELERLWFIYGNYGPKTTRGNHIFIQGLLERGEDERPFKIRGYIPTDECERAVELALRQDEQDQNKPEQTRNPVEEMCERRRMLRLITSESKQHHLDVDARLKAAIEEIKERQKPRERAGADEPGAA
jgi:hypothetical protein